MKLDKKEKVIWETSSQFKITDIPDKKLMWHRLKQNIVMQNTETKNISEKFKNRMPKLIIWNNYKYFPSIASMITIILLFFSPTIFNHLTLNKKTTTIAQKETIILIDGSKIMLNAESEITYDRNYNIKNRNIKLEGEAYFEVQNNDLPFIIETEHGKVKVLGTSFNVRSRKDGFEVGVNEGIVSISNDSTSIQLLKGQHINVSKAFNYKSISDISYEKYPDWINQKIYCKNTKLDQLFDEIERTFNVEIEFSKPSLKNITLTGIIIAKDIHEVLETISLLTQHKFKLIGDIYTFI